MQLSPERFFYSSISLFLLFLFFIIIFFFFICPSYSYAVLFPTATATATATVSRLSRFPELLSNLSFVYHLLTLIIHLFAPAMFFPQQEFQCTSPVSQATLSTYSFLAWTGPLAPL